MCRRKRRQKMNYNRQALFNNGGMKTRGNDPHSIRRVMLAVVFALSIAVCAVPLFRSDAASPTMGPINVSTTTPVAWDGTATPGTPPAANGESTCLEGTNCD